jgi:hypothetical protein
MLGEMLAMIVREFGKTFGVLALLLGGTLIQFTTYGKYIPHALFEQMGLEVEEN